MSLSGVSDSLTFFLDGVARNNGIRTIDIDAFLLEEASCNKASYLFCKVLPDHHSLKEVSLSVEGYGLEKDRPLDRFLPFLAEWIVVARRIKLVHFSIVHLRWSRNKPVQPSQLFLDWWDKNMAPILAMNWYKSKQKQSMNALTVSEQNEPSDATHLPSKLLLQVVAVNRGAVYRLVTTQVATSDPCVANASILFQMLCGHLYLPKTTTQSEAA
jgi:hypothetical protein